MSLQVATSKTGFPKSDLALPFMVGRVLVTNPDVPCASSGQHLSDTPLRTGQGVRNDPGPHVLRLNMQAYPSMCEQSTSGVLVDHVLPSGMLRMTVPSFSHETIVSAASGLRLAVEPLGYAIEYTSLPATGATYGYFIEDSPQDVHEFCDVPPAQSAPLWLSEVKSRIKQFSSLKPGWDSYRSKAISGFAISQALTIASLLSEVISMNAGSLSEAPFVAPTTSGGAIFEIRNGTRELILEVGAGASEKVTIYRNGDGSSDEEIEREVSIGESDLHEVLSWITRTR